MKKKVFFLVILLVGSISCIFIFKYYFTNQTNVSLNNINILTGSVIDNKAILDKMITDFSKINNIGTFQNFSREYTYRAILIYSIRNNKKDIWNKYFDYKHLSGELNKNVYEKMNKEDFLLLASKLFDEIKGGINVIKKEDFQIDLKIFFNQLPIEMALNNCETLKTYGEMYKDISNCRNSIYFYRAEKNNDFCQKISDSLDKKICSAIIEEKD